MEEIRIIFRHAAITAGLILLYGLLIGNSQVLIGCFTGSLLSILNFYSLCEDTKTQIQTGDASRGRAMLRYLKRYCVLGVYLAILGHYFGLSMIISGAIGLLTIKLNILLLPVFKYFKTLR